jgi:hypothetical protein
VSGACGSVRIRFSAPRGETGAARVHGMPQVYETGQVQAALTAGLVELDRRGQAAQRLVLVSELPGQPEFDTRYLFAPPGIERWTGSGPAVVMGWRELLEDADVGFTGTDRALMEWAAFLTVDRPFTFSSQQRLEFAAAGAVVTSVTTALGIDEYLGTAPGRTAAS